MISFVLRIDLGNDAMTTTTDVAEALSGVQRRLRRGEKKGFIRDLNGNTVGKWVHSEASPTPTSTGQPR